MDFCNHCQVVAHGGKCSVCGDVLNWDTLLFEERENNRVAKSADAQYEEYASKQYEEYIKEMEENEIQRLQAECQRLEAAIPRWISVEQPPKPGENVHVANSDGAFIQVAYCIDKKWYWQHNHNEIKYRIEFWIPVPTYPAPPVV
jgi:hypothetical protein